MAQVCDQFSAVIHTQQRNSRNALNHNIKRDDTHMHAIKVEPTKKRRDD
jgi:hypothetical protein